MTLFMTSATMSSSGVSGGFGLGGRKMAARFEHFLSHGDGDHDDEKQSPPLGLGSPPPLPLPPSMALASSTAASSSSAELPEVGARGRGRKSPAKPNPLISATEKCRVCFEPAAKHIHYGSVTCFSCRAFFRRSIQNNAAPNYTCKKQGQCNIDVKSRKTCQKCRFDRCLDAGMKPSWVLTEDERERRFRKTREKKRQNQQQVQPQSHEHLEYREYHDETDEQKSSSFEEDPSEQVSSDGAASAALLHVPALGSPPLRLPDALMAAPDPMLQARAYINDYQHFYEQATAAAAAAAVAAVAAVSSMTSPPRSVGFDLYSPPALSAPALSVPPPLKRSRLALTPDALPLEDVPVALDLRHNRSVEKSPEAPSSFSPAPCSSRMAEEATAEEATAEAADREVEEDASSCYDSDDSSDDKPLVAFRSIAVEPRIEMSPDELVQIKRLSDLHDSLYQSVPFGEELIKEMVMCSVFGIPLSTSAAMTAYRLMIQRVTKVAQGFDHFDDLPYQTQSSLLKQNADLLVSLRGAVFFDDKKKGLDQILFSLGVDDVEMGKKMIMTTMRSAGSMGRIDYKSFNSLQKMDSNSESEARYNRLLARVGSTVTVNPVVVKLLAYIVLFSSDFSNVENRRRVDTTQEMMINMLKRFLFSQYPRPVAVRIFANVLNSMCDLRELSHIKRQRALAPPVSSD